MDLVDLVDLVDVLPCPVAQTPGGYVGPAGVGLVRAA